MRITMKREALLEKLNERLAAAKKEDERLVSVHTKDEHRALEEFRLQLRRALLWDYAEAKQHYFQASLPSKKHPSCPTRQQNRIIVAIRMVEADTRKNPFSIAEGSDLYRAVFWEPESKRQPQTICD